MWLRELRLENLRVFENQTLEFSSGINLFVGANGAGKTSLLEAVYLLSYARSFRTNNRAVLARHNAGGLVIFGRLVYPDEIDRSVGLSRNHGRWQAQINGQPISALSDLLRLCAVVCFEPGSHALISGASEYRRNFLDWGLFHVEPNFLSSWRRYQRALRQRNALLRQHSDEAAFTPWNKELVSAAKEVTQYRRNYLNLLSPRLSAIADTFLGELGACSLHFNPGWSEATPLEVVLEQTHARDRLRGFTGEGAHRADWRLSFPGSPQREYLSRGQEKLCALACALAQAEVFHQIKHDWPIFCLDDLGSELDLAHQGLVMAYLRAWKAQVLLTSTNSMPTLSDNIEVRRFHVEPNRVEVCYN